MDRFCPKCGKDYTHDAHWTVALRRHLARKNPCDEKKTKPEMITLETMKWIEPQVIPKCKDNIDIARWFFNHMCKTPGNVCFSRPNISKDEVFVRLQTGAAKVTILEFITMWINHVMIRCFPWKQFPDFMEWVDYDTCSSLQIGKKCDGVYPHDSFFVAEMKTHMKNFMDLYPDRRHLKTMIVSYSPSKTVEPFQSQV
jgi:hypothetical protein